MDWTSQASLHVKDSQTMIALMANGAPLRSRDGGIMLGGGGEGRCVCCFSGIVKLIAGREGSQQSTVLLLHTMLRIQLTLLSRLRSETILNQTC